MSTMRLFIFAGLVAFLGTGCAAKPAAPFDTLKQSQLTIYQLTNDPGPAEAQQPGVGGLIQQLPPGLQGPIQQAMQGLGALLPGLGGAGATPVQPEAPRFPFGAPREQSFPIRQQKLVGDEGIKDRLAQLLGNPKSFGPHQGNCMAPEIGISFAGGSPQPNNVLVSFGCNKLQATSFTWPHADVGMTADTVGALSKILQDAWRTM